MYIYKYISKLNTVLSNNEDKIHKCKKFTVIGYECVGVYNGQPGRNVENYIQYRLQKRYPTLANHDLENQKQ